MDAEPPQTNLRKSDPSEGSPRADPPASEQPESEQPEQAGPEQAEADPSTQAQGVPSTEPEGSTGGEVLSVALSCRGCGYDLNGMPMDGSCPVCGQAIGLGGGMPEGLTCAGCGYDLRGSQPGASCPECGLAIGTSLRVSRWLDPTRPQEKRILRQGLFWLGLSLATTTAWFGAVLLGMITLPLLLSQSDGSMEFWAPVVLAALLVVATNLEHAFWAVGCSRVSQLGPEDNKFGRLGRRRWLRGYAWALLIVVALSCLGPMLAVLLRDGVFGSELLGIVAVPLAISTIFVLRFMTLWHLHWLLPRCAMGLGEHRRAEGLKWVTRVGMFAILTVPLCCGLGLYCVPLASLAASIALLEWCASMGKPKQESSLR